MWLKKEILQQPTPSNQVLRLVLNVEKIKEMLEPLPADTGSLWRVGGVHPGKSSGPLKLCISLLQYLHWWLGKINWAEWHQGQNKSYTVATSDWEPQVFSVPSTQVGLCHTLKTRLNMFLLPQIQQCKQLSVDAVCQHWIAVTPST